MKIEQTIKHFESLQKRYITQHNGKQCEFVSIALIALGEKYEREEHKIIDAEKAKHFATLMKENLASNDMTNAEKIEFAVGFSEMVINNYLPKENTL